VINLVETGGEVTSLRGVAFLGVVKLGEYLL